MTPTIDEYVQAFLTSMRAKPKERTQFSSAGRQVIRSTGERIIYGPHGRPIRILEDPSGGTQVEHGDHLHAVVRPPTVSLSLTLDQSPETRSNPE